VSKLTRRLAPLLDLRPGAAILDIGAAQGIHVAALQEAGFDAVGVEPWPQAVAASQEIAALTEQRVRVVEGVAESLPFEAERFDLVIALSVIEHVADPRRVFSEAFRVLAPGGGFYFTAASALCPRQPEIRHFPLFPWYPDRARRRIMGWAAEKRPDLIGGTKMPAYNWHTPRGLRNELRAAGFEHLHDRWQMRLLDEERGLRRRILEACKFSPALRFVGDVLTPGLAFLALKPSGASVDEGSRSQFWK
jgi:SAM-dependent methyltransferase